MCKEIIDQVLFFHLVSKLKDFLPFIFFYLLCFRLMKRSRVKLFCEPSSPMPLSLLIKLWVRRIVWGIFIGIWLGIRDGKFLFFFGPCSIVFFSSRCYFDITRSTSFSSKATNVLSQLGKVAMFALNLTGIFYCPVTPNMSPEGLFPYSYSE